MLSTVIRAESQQQSNSQTPPQFYSLRATGSGLVPSRRREEKLALLNLSRKTDQLIQMKEQFKPVVPIISINQPQVQTGLPNNSADDNQNDNQSHQEILDNRPQLFQKVKNKIYFYIKG